MFARLYKFPTTFLLYRGHVSVEKWYYKIVIAGQAGLKDHTDIGDDSIVLAQAGVTKSYPAKSVIMGAPAVPRKDFIKRMKYLAEAEVMVQKYKKYQHLLEDYEKFLNEDAKI